MQITQIVFRQCLVMALYMMLGVGLYKGGKISKQGSRELATLLLYLVMPAVLINSFCGIAATSQALGQLAVSGLLGGLALLLAILAARVCFPKSPIDHFAAAFSNAGFMGLPLVQAVLGSDAVFYVVGFVALLNILQWTYGVGVLTGQAKAFRPKTVLGNPITLSTLLGLALFVTGLGGRLPTGVTTALQGVAALNAPLGMLVLGVYLAQTRPAALVTTPRLYGVGAIRLLAIPLLTLALLWLVPVPREIKMAILLVAAAPVGSNVAVYAQLHEMDYSYACQTVALSTLLSVGTLPLIVWVGEHLL